MGVTLSEIVHLMEVSVRLYKCTYSIFPLQASTTHLLWPVTFLQARLASKKFMAANYNSLPPQGHIQEVTVRGPS